MIWKRILNLNNRNNRGQKARLIILPLVILGLVAYAGMTIFRLYQESVGRQIAPAEMIKINEPFSGSAHFNDKLGQDDFSQLIVSSIDQAEKTVDIAVYSMDSQDIRDALYRAAKRGVTVSAIFSDKRQEIIVALFKDKPDNVKIGFIPSDISSYMHHKFLLVDRGLSRQKLFFSSYNFTYFQGKYDPSFILETGRPELVAVFGKEFDRLVVELNDKVKQPPVNPFAARIEYTDGFLEVWFAPGTPKHNIKSRMIGLIQSSTNNIKVLIWYLTDKEIAAELAEASRTKPVCLVTDDFNWLAPGSAFPILEAQRARQKLDKLELIQDSQRNAEVGRLMNDTGFNSFLHQHLLIIDDKIALFGTNNWSFGGFFTNSESIMITDIKSLVDAFRGSYQANYDANK
ncbi:MAG: phospholipase D-like domain-containing protein [Patescibacteria group bacterium]|jgi:phosphatidylserine/phosphatidylglycerophosphate/cardiolipin synthase-like enzyme